MNLEELIRKDIQESARWAHISAYMATVYQDAKKRHNDAKTSLELHKQKLKEQLEK